MNAMGNWQAFDRWKVYRQLLLENKTYKRLL